METEDTTKKNNVTKYTLPQKGLEVAAVASDDATDVPMQNDEAKDAADVPEKNNVGSTGALGHLRVDTADYSRCEKQSVIEYVEEAAKRVERAPGYEEELVEARRYTGSTLDRVKASEAKKRAEAKQKEAGGEAGGEEGGEEEEGGGGEGKTTMFNSIKLCTELRGVSVALDVAMRRGVARKEGRSMVPLHPPSHPTDISLPLVLLIPPPTDVKVDNNNKITNDLAFKDAGAGLLLAHQTHLQELTPWFSGVIGLSVAAAIEINPMHPWVGIMDTPETGAIALLLIHKLLADKDEKDEEERNRVVGRKPGRATKPPTASARVAGEIDELHFGRKGKQRSEEERQGDFRLMLEYKGVDDLNAKEVRRFLSLSLSYFIRLLCSTRRLPPSSSGSPSRSSSPRTSALRQSRTGTSCGRPSSRCSPVTAPPARSTSSASSAKSPSSSASPWSSSATRSSARSVPPSASSSRTAHSTRRLRTSSTTSGR